MPGRNHHAEHHKYAADRRPPLWERVVAALSVLMVAGLLAYLFHQVIAGDGLPPDIVVEIVEIRDSGEDWLVVFEARNRGGETASGVSISGELSRFGIVVESSQVTLDYVPARSSRRGGLFFRRNPEEASLAVFASGYAEP
ncbi:MAG TPA: TIGR02588 family protein [Gammaproteobacteria bacterium]